MGGDRLTKRSIGTLMRKKLSDITNSQSQSLGQHQFPYLEQQDKPRDDFPTDNDCIQQLLKERVTLMQLLAERNKMIELSGAELQRLRTDIKKLQLQNWNLAQTNSHMLAELNLGRERIKTLQHEILWRAALLRGKSMDVQGKMEKSCEENGSLSQLQEGDEKAGQPPPEASDNEQQCNMNRRRIRSRSTGSSPASTKNSGKDKVNENRARLRRHSATFKTRTHEHEPLENLFEIEDAKCLIAQSGSNMVSSPAVEDETAEESFPSRNEAPRSSFGRPSRKAAEKVHSYKEIPLNVKLRRLE